MSGNADSRPTGVRNRLLLATVELVAEHGLANMTVADVLKRSGSSRSTFYEHFTDKHDCFAAALSATASPLAERVNSVLEQTAPEHGVDALIDTIVEFVRRSPAASRMLFGETLSAGPHALQQREHLMQSMQSALEEVWRDGNPANSGDLPASAIVAGVFRALSLSLHDPRRLQQLPADLRGWLALYEPSVERSPWLEEAPVVLAPHRPRMMSPMPSAQPLPRGRHDLDSAEVRRIHRERILHATALVIESKGYALCTVSDIVAAAKVSRKVFYTHFKDRQQAATEAHELTFRQLMAAATSPFFSTLNWPEQVWESTRSVLEFLSSHPMFANLGVVELQTIGPRNVHQREVRMSALALYYPDGYSHDDLLRPPRRFAEIVTASCFELCHRKLQSKQAQRLGQMLPLLSYLQLAPFLGSRQAAEFIEQQLRDRAADLKLAVD